ncbi:MAG TPA: phosphatase PAP2 family protein [Flavisolibacter sp.]|nr:phosphatase PAP2 family protein [Flavisolibacter sp.]
MPIYVLSVSFWQQLQDWDRHLFLVLNHRLVNPVFDLVLPYFRDSVFWAPFYLFVIAFVLLNFGIKGVWWALAFLATVALCDLTGTYLFKETVQRIRPCNEPSLADQVRLVIRSCPGGYSFLSNHAANHFGLATFMVVSFRSIFKSWSYLFYLWAIAVSFAQVYVGVHYPADILAGALLGVGAGFLTATGYRHYFGTLGPVT